MIRRHALFRPVTALPMIMRWISDVPSKIVKLVEVRAVSPGRWRGEGSCRNQLSAITGHQELSPRGG
jgi:hypothetical protein